MSCPGLHCAGCAGGAAVPVVPLVAFCGFAWVAEHLVEVVIVCGTCAALAVAAMVALMRWTGRREAAFARALAVRGQSATMTATAIPQVMQAERPAIPQVVNFNFYGADATRAAALIRTAIKGGTDGTVQQHQPQVEPHRLEHRPE